jgi:hypothetical protein
MLLQIPPPRHPLPLPPPLLPSLLLLRHLPPIPHLPFPPHLLLHLLYLLHLLLRLLLCLLIQLLRYLALLNLLNHHRHCLHRPQRGWFNLVNRFQKTGEKVHLSTTVLHILTIFQNTRFYLSTKQLNTSQYQKYNKMKSFVSYCHNKKKRLKFLPNAIGLKG